MNGTYTNSPTSLWLRASSEILRRTVFPVVNWREHSGSNSIYREWRKLEYASQGVVQDLQLRKLRDLLTHAYQNVPYYRQLFDSIRFDPVRADLPREFARIPVLTKAILNERKTDLIATNAPQSSLQVNASGGSTGKPVEFFQDKRYWDTSHASRKLAMSWWGVSPGDRTASVWGADRDIPDWHWRQSLYYKVCQVEICNAFSMSEERMERFARSMNDWRPSFVNGYASALELFSRFLLDRPDIKIRPIAVESSAESLSDDQRGIIEKAFDAPLYNFYGSREVNNLAAECPAHLGLHANTLSRYIEIVGDDNCPLGAGQPGKIIVTDLSNWVMPFIRYENEDVGSWSTTSCRCGRPFPLLERVWGRSSDFISTPSGKLIHGEYFTHLFYHVPEVRLFQVLQDSLDHLSISIVLKAATTPPSFSTLKAKVAEMVGSDLRVDVSIVDSIPRSASGKHRFTISRVKPNWSTRERTAVGDRYAQLSK